MNDRNGKIVTFYSYKGGVGRTMALANVAFLAAWNKMRVLIMDWDLEAPGAAYYFRGLLEPKTAKEIKQSEGILDILWEWSLTGEKPAQPAQVTDLLNHYSEGKPFSDRVKSLIDCSLFDDEYVIDYIGSGGRTINTPTPMPYEEALASFSWKDFYSAKSGGFLLESWIAWAKRSYDLILIDSRTGLADVSGICTMQLPDKVALCFILNRQNIDGVSRVSAAIRAKRQEKIELKAYAMRVSQRKTSEEDDAKARAISELSRIGGFSEGYVADTLRNFSVIADDNIPFYETIALFNTIDPETDSLANSYLRLAKDLLEQDLKMPKFDSEFIGLMRRRLDPTQATVDYILDLRNAQQERAEAELDNLIEKAILAEADGDEIRIDYVRALIDSVRACVEPTNPLAGYSLIGRLIDLLRSLSSGSAEWKRLFSTELVRFFDVYLHIFEDEERTAVLEEIDSILSEDKTYKGLLERIRYRRRACGLYLLSGNIDSSLSTLNEAKKLFDELLNLGGSSQDFSDQIWEVELDFLLKQGQLEEAQGQLETTVSYWEEGLSLALSKGNTPEIIAPYIYDFSSRLSNMRPPYISSRSASDHAMTAIKSCNSTFALLSSLPRLIDNASIIESPDLIIEITDLLMAIPSLKPHASSFYGRQNRLMLHFLRSITTLLSLAETLQERPTAQVNFWVEIVDQALAQYNRRLKSLPTKSIPQLAEAIINMSKAFETLGIDVFSYMHITLARSRIFQGPNGDEELFN